VSEIVRSCRELVPAQFALAKLVKELLLARQAKVA
jgi:hypothetical protein